MFNHGIGIHLLEADDAPTKKGTINPKDNHISFQCTGMELIIQGLKEMKIEYVTSVVKEADSFVSSKQLPLLSLNHVSYICKSVARSAKFYGDVLGFVLVKRPSSFDFEGAWLFNHGIGIHLLEVDDVPEKKGAINPKDNHISFQCSNMEAMQYVTAEVKEGGVTVDQLFFHDPDGYMIEICNCQNLPVLPLSACPLRKLPDPSSDNHKTSSIFGKVSSMLLFSGEVEALMMENLVVDMMGISF
ncbi:hypothetical protein RJ639_037591 [Escallonia herrerae]|uniref:VOC domain-containing protein n=1 Tax=Escallonia herrerae TaxID=1293975 RepID=A0AA88WIH9_9ASTE|nr:hypothetical protein RJ639_037591 [Escallonia herrerae]